MRHIGGSVGVNIQHYRSIPESCLLPWTTTDVLYLVKLDLKKSRQQCSVIFLQMGGRDGLQLDTRKTWENLEFSNQQSLLEYFSASLRETTIFHSV